METSKKEFQIYKKGVTTNGKITILSKKGFAFDRELKIKKYLDLGFEVYTMDNKQIF